MDMGVTGQDALKGAALGSAFGPWGAGIGAVGGGLYGALFGGDGNKAPQVGGPNPYQGNWNDLISQLKQRASGQGPSLAADAYGKAADDSLKAQQALSASGSPGAMRQAGMNMGQIGQGLAQGYGHARNEEMMGAQGQLQAALGGAGQAWMQPQALDLQKWQTQNGLDTSQMNSMAGLLGAMAQMQKNKGGAAAGGPERPEPDAGTRHI
jgi:hypothetical protein